MDQFVEEQFIPFGSRAYLLLLGALVFSRGMDFLSTWIATPNLVLEANPVAKKIGWRIGLVLNGIIVVLIAAWPLPAIVVITTSVLVAARNFQNAWLMRSMGEHEYRFWMSDRLRVARSLYLYCLGAQTVLYTAAGGALMYFSYPMLVPFGIGMGVITYSFAVLIYSLLSVSRLARNFS